MAGLRVHFVFPAGLVERVDAALTEGQSRGEFVRAAVEQALGGQEIVDKTGGNLPAYVPDDPQFIASHDVTFRPSAPARSSVQAKRDVRPVPKVKP